MSGRDERKSVKVSPAVKNGLSDLRKMIPFKTESEAIAYLLLVNTWAMEKMPTNIYRDAIEKARQMDKQQSMVFK